MSEDAVRHTDIAVVGAGPGGYVAAIRAAQLGYDVALVEKDAYGGVCLNYGCIPSKALLSATGLATRAASAERMGVTAEVSIDTDDMFGWKDRVVARLTGGVEHLCEANGVELIEGRATFVDERTVSIEGLDAPDRLAFENAIVATGSRPTELPGFPFDAERIWSSREALSPETVPDRLLVVGAGYIGMELSTAYARLGTDVVVVELLDEALPGFESDVTAVVRDAVADLGVEFNFGEAAADWTELDDGVAVTTETEDGTTRRYEADRTLVAVGREPVTETIGREAVGLSLDQDGFFSTSGAGETDADGIYAVGDVAGDPMLAHAASKEGILAAHAIDGSTPDPGEMLVPAAVFTAPEIATVGLTESEAAAAGYDPLVGEMPFRASGRALTDDETDGFVRVVGDEETGAVLGGQIVGADASELVAELTVAIRQGLQLDALANTVHVHPTRSEAVMEAAEHALGHAIHTGN